jgi:hypothetical protein
MLQPRVVGTSCNVNPSVPAKLAQQLLFTAVALNYESLNYGVGS